MLGVAVLGLALAAMLAPRQPLPVPIELRWLAAYLLFVVLPGWLLVRILLPVRPAARLETAILALAAGYSVAVLLGLVLHALFRPIAPWQIAAGGGLLVATLALAAWARVGDLTPPTPLSGAERGGTSSLTPALSQREREHIGSEREIEQTSSPSPASGRWGWGERASRHPRALGTGVLWQRLLVAHWPVLLLLVVAAPLRLADLGWSEFQGDEARVVLRAMAALQGADGALAAHRKVPGEILLTYLFAGSLGQILEHIARLPFALSGVGAVLAFYTLARGLLGGPAALAAGLLLAVNGYFVGFGRILQYDSLAFFLGIAGLLCCWRFGQTATLPPHLTASHPDGDNLPDAHAPGSSQGERVRQVPGCQSDILPNAHASGSAVAWAFLGSLLIVGAALVALGAIFLVPPALLLAWPGLKRAFWPVWPLWPARSWGVLAAWSWPVVPALLAAVLVLSASDPTDGPSGIWSYLGPRFGGDRPYWNGGLFLQSANHYLSTPYLLTMLSAGTFAVILGVISSLRAAGTRGLVVRLVAAVALAALTWDRPRAALAIGALFALALAMQAPGGLLGQRFGQSLGMRTAMAWAAGPLFVHLLLVRVPGTHWREAFPGLILILAALAVPALAGPRSRIVVGGLLGVLIAGVGHFSWVTIVQRQPEYQLTYPDHRHALDWTARDGRGIGGVFGVVHRHGWKALGMLSADGVLPGSFATNESPGIAAWYLRRPQGCAGAIEYIFRVVRAPQDRNLALPVPLPPGYVTRGRVREDGRSTISIQVLPASPVRLGDIQAEAYVERFDQERASAWGPIGELYRADLGLAQAKRACAAPNPQP